VSNTLGAEILRLWVAATDYSGELFISDEILKRVVESYRRIRTRCVSCWRTRPTSTRRRTPSRSTVAGDRPLRAGRGRRARRGVEGDYARYEFHLVVQRLQTFCSEDLGGFYLDVRKIACTRRARTVSPGVRRRPRSR